MDILRERADLLPLVCDVVSFPLGILGQVWYLIALILGHCFLSYFAKELRLTYCTNYGHSYEKQYFYLARKIFSHIFQEFRLTVQTMAILMSNNTFI